MKLIINDFDNLKEDEQENIQDLISGFTTNYELTEDKQLSKNLNFDCDYCNNEMKLNLKKIVLEDSVINLCPNCIIGIRK